ERLIRYNIEDCRAAEVVAAALQQLQVADQSKDAGYRPTEVVFVRSLKPPRKRFGKFKSPVQEFDGITEAAWWDYHRDRIYLKSKATKRRAKSSSNGKELGP